MINEKSDMATDAKPRTTLPGIVEKIIKSPNPREPEQAEISVADAEPLYQEIRIENKLKDEDGKEVSLKPGASVDITIEADAKDTERKTREPSFLALCRLRPT
jgi:hypothetical protein